MKIVATDGNESDNDMATLVLQIPKRLRDEFREKHRRGQTERVIELLEDDLGWSSNEMNRRKREIEENMEKEKEELERIEKILKDKENKIKSIMKDNWSEFKKNHHLENKPESWKNDKNKHRYWDIHDIVVSYDFLYYVWDEMEEVDG